MTNINDTMAILSRKKKKPKERHIDTETGKFVNYETNYRVGTTSGLHYIARSEELATSIRKLGFTLTRGTSVIQLDQDVPHEVNWTDGKEIRSIAFKQGIEIASHGSLTIPMAIPERSDWRDADDHMKKSIRSAVFSGSKYVVFHTCMNVWLELITYASRKLTMSFCDHEGHFISKILQECEPLREWFVERRGDFYARDILTNKESVGWQSEARIKMEGWEKDDIQRRLSAIGVDQNIIDTALQVGRFPEISLSHPEAARLFEMHVAQGKSRQEAQRIVDAEAARRNSLQKEGRKVFEAIQRESIIKRSKIQDDEMKDAIRRKLARKGRWDTEELRTAVGILDGYHIMAQYMFFTKDPMWVEFAKLFPALKDRYKMDYGKRDWLENAWRQAEDENDREFKKFFYGVVGAKYLEGHVRKIMRWISTEFMAELSKYPDGEELKRVAKELVIAIENPESRDPQHAGLHLLWDVPQIYAAVKTIRKTVKGSENVWLLADFEHWATQGVDPVQEMEKLVKEHPDYGLYCIAVHANAPNPTHAHEPIEFGDVRIYKLLRWLWQTGFGRTRPVYVIYERGGGEDPYKKAISALRLMVNFMVQDIPTDKLPPEFFGVKGAVEGGVWRQRQIIRDHMYEPLKDLLEMPDEEFTMLSSTILKKGKRPEQWKKAEFR